MTNVESRVVHLEQLLRQMDTTIGQMQGQVAALQQALRTTPSASPYGSGGGSGIYSMAGVVIGAGGSVTGMTVNGLINGSTVAVSTNGTVYNQMQVATVAGKTIMLGGNPDGSFSAVSQSC
jgi:hypothetical protein